MIAAIGLFIYLNIVAFFVSGSKLDALANYAQNCPYYYAGAYIIRQALI